jgi:hypothetical protein
MKIYSKLYLALVGFVYLFISYALCSSHELPESGYVSRRKRFCSTPLDLLVLICLFIILFLDNITNFISKFKV